MNTLLFCKKVFDEYCFTRCERDLTDDEREQIARRRQEMQRIMRDKGSPGVQIQLRRSEV